MIEPSSSRCSTATIAAAVAFAIGAAACGDPPGPSPAPSDAKSGAAAPSASGPAEVALDADDPATCAPCHGAVVEEWRESLHSRASHANDPVYAAMRSRRTAKEGAHVPAQCAACHEPGDVDDQASKAAKLGVGCATCHQLDRVHLGESKKGVHALVKGPPNRFRGPHDVPAGTSPAHENGPALPALVDGVTLCLACHAEEKNAAGLPTCTTGLEHAAWGEKKEPCTSCHMEEVAAPSGAASPRPTHRSHRFRGPHQANRLGEVGIMAEAVSLSGSFRGDAFVARVENRSGHAFPTGFPGRMAMLEIRALDAAGVEVHRNITSDPMKDHPEAVFNMAFEDAEGKPTLAAFATKKVRDTRLSPGEVREISRRVPPAAAKVELRLRFFLVPPPLAKALAYDGPEVRPIALAPVVVDR